MFPQLGDYTVIKIPTIPYPLTLLKKVRRVLASDKMEKKATELPEDVLEGLKSAGLVQITSKGTVYATDLGKRIHDILKWV